jgi:hypothetical protein
MIAASSSLLLRVSGVSARSASMLDALTTLWVFDRSGVAAAQSRDAIQAADSGARSLLRSG